MIGTLEPSIAARVVGVIDLVDGRAVHAVAGNRDAYRDVAFCHGDPVALVTHYRGLGVRQFYIADLDSIRGGSVQHQAIEALLQASDSARCLIDLGWCAAPSNPKEPPGPKRSNSNKFDAKVEAIERLSNRFPPIQWIAATESCRSRSDLQVLADRTRPGHWLLGLDYRRGELLRHEADESEWISAARQFGCAGAVILDLAAVGTGSGPQTAEACRRVRRLAPTWTILSGGGVCNQADAGELIDAGCDGILIATALYPCTPSSNSGEEP